MSVNDVDRSFLTASTNSAATTTTTTTTLAASASLSSHQDFKPTSLIPTTRTLIARDVKFRMNAIRLAAFYEENQHYCVPLSEKKLFQFAKNMKAVIRSRREIGSAASRKITEAQYKVLKDILFVDYTVELDKSKKQQPVTRAFRNVVGNIDSFVAQNGHTNVLDPDAKMTKAVKRSDGTTHNISIIASLQNAYKTLQHGRLGKERKNKLKAKGINLDTTMIGSELMVDRDGNDPVATNEDQGEVQVLNEDTVVNHEDERAESFEIRQVKFPNEGETMEGEEEITIDTNICETVTGRDKYFEDVNDTTKEGQKEATIDGEPIEFPGAEPEENSVETTINAEQLSNSNEKEQSELAPAVNKEFDKENEKSTTKRAKRGTETKKRKPRGRTRRTPLGQKNNQDEVVAPRRSTRRRKM